MNYSYNKYKYLQKRAKINKLTAKKLKVKTVIKIDS